MNSSCWRETLKSDSWKVVSLVYEKWTHRVNATNTCATNAYFCMNSEFHLLLFTECIRNVDVKIAVTKIDRISALLFHERQTHQWRTFDGWTATTSYLIASCLCTIGCFLKLRRVSLLVVSLASTLTSMVKDFLAGEKEIDRWILCI